MIFENLRTSIFNDIYAGVFKDNIHNANVCYLRAHFNFHTNEFGQIENNVLKVMDKGGRVVDLPTASIPIGRTT